MIEWDEEIMKITNAKIYIDGSFVDGGIAFDSRITAVGETVTGPADVDAKGCYVIPGLVDIHSHGAVGEDSSDGIAEGLPKMARHYAAEGVTSWCPTTMTLPEEVLTKVMHIIRAYERPEDGAKIAGINLEGPFLSAKKKGAQAEENLHAPDAGMFHRLNDASGGMVKMVTVAPEEPGAIPFIREVSREATVSLGHTVADYDTAMQAYKAGASHTTHLYNGMPGLHHREPGVIGAAYDAGATVELIADGFHIHPAVVRMTSQLYGENLVLISDSVRAAGMPDGEYLLGGLPFTMKDGKATLTGTDTLAGSCIHLMDGLRRSVSFGVPLEKAVMAATLAPAKVIGADQEIGSLSVGKCADLVILDESLQVKAVYINGKCIRQSM
jgi:N-acetylglucosamine-6-phosphate deacetylase